jgi:hypothetical protein
MKRSHLLTLGVIALMVVVAWLWLRPGEATLHSDLIELYDEAEKRSSKDLETAFRLTTVTIDGDTRRAIFMHPDSRLTFERVMIPDDGALRTWIALSPEVWDREGDGVLFRFGVSDGRSYDQFVTQVVDPIHNPNDRRWIPLTVDLSAYAGQRVDLIFNTNASPPGRPVDARHDWALWAEPAIVLQR